MVSQFFTTDLLLALLAMFLPPVPVGIKRGCGVDLLINMVLCLLGIPAVLHAWYIIIRYPDDGIPFIDVRRGRYDIIPDVENEPNTPPESENNYGHNDTHIHVQYSSSSAPQSPETAPNLAAGSSSNPPPYSEANHPTPGLDNKIQYD